jgi:NTE family protein
MTLASSPRRIAGTSIGSLMGVAYAAGLSAQVIEDHARSVLSNRLDAARLAFSSGKGGVLDLVRFNPLSNPLVDGPQLVRLVLPDGVPDRLDHLAIPWTWSLATSMARAKYRCPADQPLKPLPPASPSRG